MCVCMNDVCNMYIHIYDVCTCTGTHIHIHVYAKYILIEAFMVENLSEFVDYVSYDLLHIGH